MQGLFLVICSMSLMVNIKPKGTRRTSDIGTAAFPPQQIQQDGLIDVMLTERVCSTQDIRMDISFFPVPQARAPSICLLHWKTQKKDKDMSGADRPQENRSPFLFASWYCLWFDPGTMIVMKTLFRILKVII